MQTNHTAGPWKLSETASRCIIGNSAHGGRMSVCVMQNTQSEHYQANCKLVAAAPDLLAALELIGNEPNYNCNCVEQHSWYGGGHCTACPVAIAQDAISKAKGAQ